MSTSSLKICAILIVKGTDDEALHLRRCLENIMPHVDHVFINLNIRKGEPMSKRVLAVVRKYDPKFLTYIETEWKDNYGDTRNANLAQVTPDYDWIIWLDTDDTIDKPGKVRKVAEASDKFDSIFVDYLYDRDEEENPTMVHLVARMFKNNGSHMWKPGIRVHETLIETRGVTQGATKDFVVIHHADQDRTNSSFDRNIRLLELQMRDEEKDPDPRTFFYLATVYMDAGQPDAALSLFEDYLQLSGWDQERCVALTKMGQIYIDKGDRTKAREMFARAISEDPTDPAPRVELGSLEVETQNYAKAASWLEYVEGMEKNMTTLERNPMTYTFRLYMLLGECYLNLGGAKLPKAVEYGEKALKYKKKNKDVKAWVKMMRSVTHDRDLTKDLVEVYKELKKNKETDKMEKLLEAVPKQLDDNPVFVQLRDQDRSFKWPEKSIVIMTGDTMIDEWGPWSLKDGIGGSEEAIIRIAPHLRDLGYRVVIFAKPGPNAGLHEGIMWRNYWEVNLKDEFDTFVGWRSPGLFEKEIKAKKKFLWMHDVMEIGEFTRDRLASLDKVIVLSKYHRSLFPMIPDDKIMLSGNGIDPEDFKQVGKLKNIKRDPHKIFYGSSHVRGLAYLYEIWPEVRKAIPDATLDVYYGRESYDAVHKGNPERMKWMDDLMLKAQSLEGVTDHGKVGQEEINRAIFSSGVWAYPCPFPEIYCITAIKAQAGGAIPVSSDFGALDETVQFGYKVKMAAQKEGAQLGKGDQKFLGEYKERLIDMLGDKRLQADIRPDMVRWAKTNSWRKVAKSWVKEIESPIG